MHTWNIINNTMKSFDNNTFCNNHQKSSSSSSSSSSMNKTSSTSIKHRHHPNHPQKYEQQHQQQEHIPPPSPPRQFSKHLTSPLLCHNNTHYLDNASGNNICSPNNRHFPNSNTASLPIRLSTPSSPSKKRRRNNHTMSMQNHLLCFKKSKWNVKYMRNFFCIFFLSGIFGVQVWFQRLALIQNNDDILKVSSRNMILESSSSSVVSLSLDKTKSMSNDDVASSISSIQGRSKLQSKQNLRYEFQKLDKSETFNTVHKMLKDISLLKRMKPLSISLPPISAQFNIPTNSSSIIDRYEITNSNYERKNDVKSVSIGSSRQTDQRSDCKSVHRWHTSNYPTCNDVHGVGGDLLSSFVHLLSAGGSWRMAWRIDNGVYAPEIKDDDFAYESLRGINDTSWNLDEYNSPIENVVLKMLKVSQDPDFETYERHRKDAVAMEVLTSSDNIIDIYGFCGNSVLTEMAVGDAAILLKQKSLHTLDRLKIARDLAKAIDEVHRPRVISHDPSFSSTAIAMVHNDVNPSNVVAVRGGRLKINDFNLVEFIQQNETSHEECGFPIMFSNPLWRAPEEIRNITGSLASSKVDTYGLCNILFQVLTKHTPYKWLEPYGRPPLEEVIKMKLNGTKPHFPEEFTNSSKQRNHPPRHILYLATTACYQSDPFKRPSAKQMFEYLNESLEMIEESRRKNIKPIIKVPIFI